MNDQYMLFLTKPLSDRKQPYRLVSLRCADNLTVSGTSIREQLVEKERGDVAEVSKGFRITKE